MDVYQPYTEAKQNAEERIDRVDRVCDSEVQGFCDLRDRQRNEIVRRCIRYMLCRNFEKIPVRRAELSEYMFQSMGLIGSNNLIFTAAIKTAQQTLRNTFGMEIAEISKTVNPRPTTQQHKITTAIQSEVVSSTKGYILVSVLPQECRPENGDSLPVIGFLMVVASMILLQPSCSLAEEDLYAALKRVGVHMREKQGHKQLHGGNVKELLEEVLVEQWYLERQLAEDTIFYTLGPRLRAELSDDDLIDFVNTVYRGRPDSQATLDENDLEELKMRLKVALV